MKNSRKCAFCGSSQNITAEHVWPSFLLKKLRMKGDQVSYNMKSKKKFRGDHTIKDVCRSCNNGELSKLDYYLSTLYEKYFSKTPKSDNQILFNYDFGVLSRSLLKISFNSSRSTGIDKELLSEYTNVISSQYPTSPINVGFFVATARSHAFFDNETKTTKMIEPRGIRSGPVYLSNSTAQFDYTRWCAIRALIINGYRFIIVIMKQPTIDGEEFADICSNLGVPLMPNGITVIPPPQLTTLDLFDGVQYWPS